MHPRVGNLPWNADALSILEQQFWATGKLRTCFNSRLLHHGLLLLLLPDLS